MSHRILMFINSSLLDSGIKSILEKEEFLLDEVHNWLEVFDSLKNETPGVILIDFIHFNNSDIDSLKKLRNDFPQIPILLIIYEGFTSTFKDFILIGINGIVFSNSPASGLIKAIDSVTNGQVYFPNSILNLFKESTPLFSETSQAQNNSRILTNRETAICNLISNGLTNKEIAAELFISPRTVETHKKNILAKLKAKSTADIIKYTIKHQSM